MVSRYQENPRMMHWKIVKRILQYLKGIVDYSFCYQGKKLCLVGYSHVFWEGDLDERKSTSRYTILLNNGVNLWKSKKQTCITLSTMEIEFTVCLVVILEVVWLKRFLLQSLGKVKDDLGPTTIYNDSQAVITYVKDPKYHGKTKHIDTKNNFIRDIITQKEVILKYVPTHEMVVDPFVKSIIRNTFSIYVKSLGLRRL